MNQPMSEVAGRIGEGGDDRPGRYMAWGSEARPDIRESLAILGQRKWSIMAIVVIVVTLAILASAQQTPIYKSEAWVLVTAMKEGGSSVQLSELIEPNLATEARLAESVAVAEIAVDELGTDASPLELLDDLKIGSPDETEILTFTYSHSDPAEAQRRAQGFAAAYIEYRRRSVVESIAESAEALQDELIALRTRLDRLERDLTTIAEDDPRATALESEASLLQGLILQRQIDRVGLSESFSAGRIVQPAAFPKRPASPNHVLNAGLGLVAGLALALGIAFLQDRLSSPLRSEAEAEMYLGAPVLGAIPRVPAWKRRKQAFLVTRHDWGSPASEAYRILRTNLLSSLLSTGGRSVLVTSAAAGEGKTTTAANLGVVLARAGKKVILVSADLRRPRLHEFFAMQPPPGIPDVLTGRVSLDHALISLQPNPSEPELENLRLLASRIVPEDSAELLGSQGMHELLHQLLERAEIVIIDAPPVLPVTDAQVLARMVDGVLIVVGPRSATKASVDTIRQQLAKVGARVIGAVLNGPGTGRITSSRY